MKKNQLFDKRFLMTFFSVIAVLVIVPIFIQRPFTVNVLILCLIWSIMGIGWNFIGGYTGQVSNGHALYFAIGAYTGALLLKWFSITPWISMWIGAAVSALVAFVIGMPLLRLSGHYFAIATMAIVESARIIFLNWGLIGGATGVSFLEKIMSSFFTLQFVAKHPFYYVCLIFFALMVLLSKALENTRFGFYCQAIKANPESAQSVGINTTNYKSIAYMLSAAVVSIGGALYAQYIQYIDPMMLLPLSTSMLIVLVCVMGGIGTVWGPVLGAFLMTFINEYSRSLFVHINGMNFVVYGVLVILIVLFLPKGLLSIRFNKFYKKERKSHD
jgi:branched-chain amino acid transport system permease protein